MYSFSQEAIAFGRSPLFYSLFWTISGILGLAFGSFANVCILRLPEDQSVGWPASHCPICKHPIPVRDNIPILSYVLLRGRCRFCRQPISRQYALVEAAMLGLFLFNSWIWNSFSIILLADILVFYSLTISIIDYRHRIIPDELSLSLIVIGLTVAWWNPFLGAEESGLRRLIFSATAMIAGGGSMLALAWLGEKLFKKEALGGGDIKLVAAFGALLGWAGLWGSLLFGSLTGAATGLFLMALHQKKRGDTLPFGPYLCFGAFLVLFLPAHWMSFLLPIFP